MLKTVLRSNLVPLSSPVLGPSAAEGSVRPKCFLIPLIFSLRALQWYRCSTVGMFSVRYSGKITLYHCRFCQYGWIGMRVIGIANGKMRKIHGLAGLLIYICSTPFAYGEHKAGFALHCQLSHWIFPCTFALSPSSWLVYTRASTLSLWAWMICILLFHLEYILESGGQKSPFQYLSTFPLVWNWALLWFLLAAITDQQMETKFLWQEKQQDGF